MARATVLHAVGWGFDSLSAHQIMMMEDLEKIIEALDNFDSEDGLHHVEWDYWYDSKNDTSYDTWVCTTHNKQYYSDCAQKG